MLQARAVKINGSEEIFVGNSLFQIRSGNYWQNVGHYEQLGFIGGPPGSMKSTILRYIAAAGSQDCEPFGFRLNLGDKRIVWFDGEQPRDIVVNSINHIKDLANCGEQKVDVLSYLDMYELNGITAEGMSIPAARRKEMWRILREDIRIHQNKEIGVIVVDNLANFVTSVMDWTAVETFLGQLMTIAKRYKCMVLILSHITKDGEKLFGAGGTKLLECSSWGLRMSKQQQFFQLAEMKLRYGTIAPKVFLWGKGKNELIEQGYQPF